MNTLFLDGHVEAVSPMRLVEATKRHSTLTALNRGFWIVHQNGKFEWWIW